MEKGELKEQAKAEMNNLAKTFGKYVVIKEKEPLSVRKNPIERETARLANRIYKKICEDMKISLCFFSDFSTWSDYVRGRIGEAEFHSRARVEAEKMISHAKAA